jgi:ABC-type sulfate transport system permease subunit
VTPLIAAITLVFVFAGLAALGVMLVAALFRVTADGPGTVLARRPSQEQADDIGR